MKIDLTQLAKFLVKAKIQTYASDGKEIEPQRQGFKELEFKEGDWEYRDSYAGFYFFPGQEIVRVHGKPIWIMSYAGGMIKEHHTDKEFAKKTYEFLKKAMRQVTEQRPFRGPKRFKEKDWEYSDESEGDIRFFRGTETIKHKGKEVYMLHYIGSLVIPK